MKSGGLLIRVENCFGARTSSHGGGGNPITSALGELFGPHRRAVNHIDMSSGEKLKMKNSSRWTRRETLTVEQTEAIGMSQNLIEFSSGVGGPKVVSQSLPTSTRVRQFFKHLSKLIMEFDASTPNSLWTLPAIPTGSFQCSKSRMDTNRLPGNRTQFWKELFHESVRPHSSDLTNVFQPEGWQLKVVEDTRYA